VAVPVNAPWTCWSVRGRWYIGVGGEPWIVTVRRIPDDSARAKAIAEGIVRDHNAWVTK